MNKELLIIFTESPLHILPSSEKLNIQSRIDLYKKAFNYCCSITMEIKEEKIFLFDESVFKESYQLEQERKFLKLGSDRGEEMLNAFLKGFIKNYTNIILIRNATFEITFEIIEEAFKKLETFDYVIGPLKDKSFYLLGMKKLNPFIFEKSIINNKQEFQNIIHEFEEKNASYCQLQELKEITENDAVSNFAF
jgi:uncharacterized protein